MKIMVHIYFGDGKGKTTAAIGLALRAVGAGKKVVLAQFLKNDDSSEISVLRKLENLTVCHANESFGFVWNMTSEEKMRAAAAYNQLFENCKRLAQNNDMLVMDEIISAIEIGFIEQAALIDLINQNTKCEIVLTGRNPSEALMDTADYLSQINNIRNPYDKGAAARKGIEY